jgi:hypothetical protein
MNNFVEVIDQWPTVTALAEDIGEKLETVRKWKTRRRIPSHRWLAVAKAARSRGIELTVNDLAVISGLIMEARS